MCTITMHIIIIAGRLPASSSSSSVDGHALAASA
jgi:hypothetical protein